MTAPTRLSLPFRIGTYSTLMIACLTLGYSEWDLVPESIAFTAVVALSLVVSFAFEGRISLGLGKANLIGLGIGIVAVGWLALKYTRGGSESLAHLTWPANLLPYMGPLVMILMPAKLFRPKHAGDWWTMHGIALAAIVLASSMTDDPFFLVLVAMYAVAAVWSLTLFYFGRSGGIIPAIPGRVGLPPMPLARARPDRRPADGERGAWWHSLLWLAVAGAVALPVFFLSPRSTGERWGFTKSRLETGYNPESKHDMDKTGDLEASAEVAFEVKASHRDGSPKTEADPNLLWRGASYSDYESGSWVRKSYVSSHVPQLRPAASSAAYSKPDLGPSQYAMEFRPSEKMAGAVLASPLAWAKGQESPVSSAVIGGRVGWSASYDGSFIAGRPNGRSIAPYVQQMVPPAEANLGPAMESYPPSPAASGDPERVLLTRMRLPKIREWSVALLAVCVAAGKLPRAILDTAETRSDYAILPEYHERVGRTFRDYFLNSGEFEYTAKLRRIDKKIDPIEDFLFNVRAGHCERFASALALALRALGIPAQFVIGFKGFDAADDGETMTIRQEHAHAWVEVLISRPGPDGVRWHRLALDPTPGSYATPPSAGSWFDSARAKGVTFLNDFIIGYNPAKRVEAFETLRETAVEWAPPIAVAAGLALIALAVRKRYRRRAMLPARVPESDLAWYGRYLDALRPHGFVTARGETAKEFAERAAAALRAAALESVAAVPAFVTSKLYRVRYAGASLSAVEEAEIAVVLATLETALASRTAFRTPPVPA